MQTARSTNTALRTLSVLAAAVVSFGVTALPASAHHADEKVEVSKTNDLADGETVKVTFSGFTTGGKPAKVVIAGQGEITTIPDKLNFDEYGSAPEVAVSADGTGSFDFVATADHGTMQDGSTLNCLTQQCWIIVVQEPFLPQPNYDSVPITFAGGSVAATETTVAGSTETTVAPTETTAAPTETTAVAPETTAAEATTTTVADDTDTTSAAADDTTDDDEGGSGALYAIIAAVVVALGAGGYFISRRKPPVG